MCSYLADLDGCAVGVNPCHAQATCVDISSPGNGASCTCNAGYSGDGITCSGMHPCNASCSLVDSLHADLNGCLTTNCGPHTTCTDKAPPATDGTCSCNTGYSQDDLGTLGCTICTEGYGRNVTSGLCAICPAGKFSGSNAIACSTCGANEFSSAGASFCSTCLAAF